MTNVSNPRKYAAWFLSLALVATLVPLAGPAGAVGTFDDDDGNIHESAIEDIAALGITLGCNPPANTLYCPDDYVTRQQMASFLVRTFDLPPGPAGQFTDISGSVHENDINALAASGITRGCNPPANDQYCPRDVVTRGQMAAFMARGLDLDNVSDPDFFGDDDSNIFELQINAIARVGITRGCNPPENTEYCPDSPVRRDEMATFLSRVAAIVTTGTTSTTTPGSTTSTTTPGSTTSTTTLPDLTCHTTVPADALIVNNPYSLDFGGNAGGLCDSGDTGTGFTWLDQPSHPAGDGYVRSLLDVTGGELRITTTPGLFETDSNDQDNALAVPLNPQITHVVETSIISPPQGTLGGFEQGGVWFGNDEDNYVKVVLLTNNNGPAVQTRVEVNGIGGATRTISLDSHPSSIELRLTAAIDSLSVQGEYRLPGGSWQTIGSSAAVPVEFFTIDQAGTTTNTFAGLLTSHRDGPSPVTYRFDRFSATGTVSSINCDGGGGLDCIKTPVSYKPTAMEWYGNRLYVLGATGTVYRYTVNSNGTLNPDGAYSKLPPPSGGIYTALGLAIQPGTSTTSPTVWLTTSITGGANFLEGKANSSTVWRITNIAGSGQTTAMITGLPRAYENHAINSIHFHPTTLELYIAQGGNTGAGEANAEVGSAFGTRPEQPLSAAWLRADVLGGWSPSQNGACATQVSDGPPPSVSKTVPNTCDVEVVATGLRNMYDFVFHSNGNVYGPDNGLGVNGTVPEDYQPDCRGYINPYSEDYDPGPQADRLQLLQAGKYYGHPNPSRDECVFFNGNFQSGLHGTTVHPLPNFEPAYQVLNTSGGASPRSLNSIIEYSGGPWDGDMLITAFAGSAQGLYRFDLAENCNAGSSAWSNGCLPRVGPALGAPLGVEQINNGRIVVGEWITRQSSSSYLVVLTPTG